jgi:hypothetical protein
MVEYILISLAAGIAGWLLRAHLPPPGSPAPEGQVEGSKSMHVLFVKHWTGRVAVFAHNRRRVPAEILAGWS